MLAKSISIDKELNNLSLKSQLIYTWCVPFLDDFGLLTNNSGNIKYLIFPRNPHISEEDIQAFMSEVLGEGLVDGLEDCLFFKGFTKHNPLTEYKKSKSEFTENGYNQGKSKYSPEIPSEPRKVPSKDKISKGKVIKDKISKGNIVSRDFVPPTLEEIKNYCLERLNNVSPDKFINFYASKGWMVGKNKMKNWQAAVRTWEEDRVQPKRKILNL